MSVPMTQTHNGRIMGSFFKNRPANDYRHLLALVPNTEFPREMTRSTIPALSYWRDPEFAATALLTGVFGCSEMPLGDLHFEYEVPAFGGNMPSCTDVFYLSLTTAIAVEGKWTEPLYGTAAKWLEAATKP